MTLSSLLFALLVAALPASDGDPEKTPLQLRAEAACTGFDQLGSEAEKRERQDLLLALADSLEAEGFDVHASHCLERAGIFSYQFAEYDEAMDIWDRGLVAARRSEDGKRIAALLNASAIGVSVTGDNERAVDLQLELILLRRQIGDPRGEGSSWYNLAYSYEALYRVPEAIEAFRQALVLLQQAGNSYGVALTRNALSNSLFDIGQIEEALALADSAVADAEREGAPLLVGNALGARAYKRHVLGHDEEALEDFERARAILVEGGVVRVAATTAINHARSLTALGRCEEALVLLDEVWPELDRAETHAERIAARAARGRALSACGREGEAREELRGALAELAEFRAALDTELGRAESFRLAGAAYTDLAALEAPFDAWSLVEGSSAALLREELGADRIELERFQQELGSIGAIALQFSAATPEYILAFVVTPESVDRRIIELPPDFVREAAMAMHLLASGTADEFCRPVLERLGETLLQGLELESDRILVLAGGLAGVPIEALPYRGSELGARAAVTYAPSATAFVGIQERVAGTGPMLALADPSVARSEDEPFGDLLAMRRPLEPLPEAREEVELIAVRGTKVLMDEGASRERFLEDSGGCAVLHFATHAVVDASHPDHSAIVLANSELVNAREIEGLQLGADLVSLSGCSTANGYLVAGEGTLGLTRAFLLAGARTVVASWWDVEDAAARRFMELFYAELSGGEDRDRALQRARAKMAQEGYPARDRLAFAMIGATATPVEALRHDSPFPGLRIWMALAGFGLIVAWFRYARQSWSARRE
jgi:tetratricopeptide (TPR) repeat protein